MKKLLIVESPGKIKTILKFLGSDFKIMSTVGHIKDLPEKKLGIHITDKSITLDYVPLKDKEKIIAELVKAAKNAQEIYLAPDPDREGEIIAWHTQQEIMKVADQNKIHRIAFNEITKPAILQAIANPGTVNMPKVYAQQARRVLDRWVGYEVSPILWKKLAKGLSAGRVQSVALKLVCNKELEIRAFKVKEYWSIQALFQHNKQTMTATLVHYKNKTIEPSTQQEAEKIVKDLQTKKYIIASITDKDRIKNAMPPFITSSLQQAAANKLNMPVKKTMSIAQQMYEGVTLQDPKSPVALITYMRTDSTRLSQTALDASRDFIKTTWGETYLPTKPNIFGKKEKAQDAHEAIRPIDMHLKPEDIKPYVSSEIFKLYDLIWARTIASQMKPAIYAQRQIIINADDYTFKATGSTLIFDGFLKAYEVEEDENDEKTVALPKNLTENQILILDKLQPKQHFTEPPTRFSEASLVKELEKQGIGRPSTYATILTTIQTRKYVEIQKKRFVPTDLGMKLVELLNQYFAKIMDLKFTAHMEEDLDKIAQGTIQKDAVLFEFWNSFEKDLQQFQGLTPGSSKKVVEETPIMCPTCNKHKLVVRLGKNGSFLGCPGFPECTFTSQFRREEDGSVHLVETQEAPLLDETCPQCTKQLRKMKGRFGEFVACSGYPTCKFIKQNIAHFACPDCKGNIVQRSWRGGKFWGCQNYPKCKFSIFSDIDQSTCSVCKAHPYMLKKIDKQGNISLTCPNKDCKT